MYKKLCKIAAASLIGSLLISSAVLAAGDANYEVTITNLTRAQTFTPILVVSHRNDVKIFELGSAASSELSELAEGGDIVPLQTELEANENVIETVGSGELLTPGESVTVTVSALQGANRISLASMLIPTNDSFIALNGVKAPEHGESTVYYSPGYDAGTESNDESCQNIPGPVCGGEGGSSETENDEGYVHISGGIHGIADLAAETYDWRNPTAKIVIKKVPAN
jgi:archaellum component FlaF (FlaF/FlaG flagellin family)